MRPARVGSDSERLSAVTDPSIEGRLRQARPKLAKAGLRTAETDRREWGNRGPTFRNGRAQAQSESAFETHFAVEDLARVWGMSEDFVRRLFLKEPGVVVFYNQRPGRRVYRTLRIPESVALRVHQRMRKA